MLSGKLSVRLEYKFTYINSIELVLCHYAVLLCISTPFEFRRSSKKAK